MTSVTVHWQLVVGTLFVLLVLFFPRGVWGSLTALGEPVSAAPILEVEGLAQALRRLHGARRRHRALLLRAA